MSFQDKLLKIQRSLIAAQLDGWLFYDFRGNNDLACKMLDLPADTFLTRRFFYWIPEKGTPIKILHRIEDHVLNHLPGDVLRYQTWEELESHIAAVLKNSQRIAMEYSPRNAIPYVSKIDAGTMDVVRGFGVDVVSSADLLQQHTSVWSSLQLQSHLDAADVLCKTVDKAWNYISDSLKKGVRITEYDVQQFMLLEFEKLDCVTAGSPICAVNANSALPHYSPDKDNAEVIEMGDFILIDLWCKKKTPQAVYADITRVGVAAKEPTERQQEIFSVVKSAQDAATEFVSQRFNRGTPVMGWEVDRCCRDVIVKSGFGHYFIHRTGHNIDTEDHGGGANIDSLETQDSRLLLPGTCFSIEPGIYLPGEFGVRLEYDVFVHHNGHIQITGGIQEAITCLFC